MEPTIQWIRQEKLWGNNLFMIKQKNVLGEELESCSTDPMTGWFRDAIDL